VRQNWKHGAKFLHPARKAGCATLFFLGLAVAGAQTTDTADLPAPVTLNLPIPVNQATPAWLGHPLAPASIFATLDLPILTPDTSASLLVTTYFQEKDGGFLRVIWKGTQGAVVLADNLYEGIGLTNQRSVLIPSAMLVGDGTLEFQSSDSALSVAKIRLEWLVGKVGLVSPEVNDVTVTAADGETQMSQDLTGQTPPVQKAMWQDQVVSVPLTDAPVRIEAGVDFSVDIDKVPGTARVSLKEAGLALGQHLVAWVNGQRAGVISPNVPDLLDDGYSSDTAGVSSYSGWRDGSFYVPVALLQSGTNSVAFTSEGDVPSSSTTQRGDQNASDAPLAVKNVTIQLSYQPPGPKAGLTQPESWQTASTPIAPDSSDPLP
jgi:hypothetical protein